MNSSNDALMGNVPVPSGIKRLFSIIIGHLSSYFPELKEKEAIVCIWIVWAHNDLKFGCYDCIVSEIAEKYDIFRDKTEIKETIEALVNKGIIRQTFTKEASHNISLSLENNLQDKIVNECRKSLAFVAEEARKIGKITCPQCGSIDINVSTTEPKTFMFCNDCSILRIPDPMVENEVDNKNKRKRKIDQEFLNDLTLACIKELMSSERSDTPELNEKVVYMSDDYATFNFSSPAKKLSKEWTKIGTIKPPEKKLDGIESIRIAPRYLYEVNDGNNSISIGSHSYDWNTLREIYYPFIYEKSFVNGSIVDYKGYVEYIRKRALAEGWFNKIKEEAESIANSEINANKHD